MLRKSEARGNFFTIKNVLKWQAKALPTRLRAASRAAVPCSRYRQRICTSGGFKKHNDEDMRHGSNAPPLGVAVEFAAHCRVVLPAAPALATPGVQATPTSQNDALRDCSAIAEETLQDELNAVTQQIFAGQMATLDLEGIVARHSGLALEMDGRGLRRWIVR
jgi:hypothetical protein